ncbi:MAG: DUF4476 domain-containing protein [Bacteroidales bacterium]
MKKIIFSLICTFLTTIVIAQSSDLVQTGNNTTSISEKPVLSNYKGICGCSNPLNEEELKLFISEIKTKNSDVRMLSYSKQNIKGKCLLASQIKEIALLFTYDDTRNNFVKFSHAYIYDMDNYSTELLPFLVTPVSTKFGQAYTKCAVNSIWVNPSYTAETARHFYYYGY